MPDNFMITLRAARINAGLTLVAVRRATGIPTSSLSRYERDSSVTTFTCDRAIKLLKLYGISSDRLWIGKESEFHARPLIQPA